MGSDTHPSASDYRPLTDEDDDDEEEEPIEPESISDVEPGPAESAEPLEPDALRRRVD